MRFSDMGPTKYLKADDFEAGPRVLVIAGFSQEEMNDGRLKWVLHFRDESRGLPLNATNLANLGELFEDSDQSIGERVELFLAPTNDPAGRRVQGIRLRSPRRLGPDGAVPRRYERDDGAAPRRYERDDGAAPRRYEREGDAPALRRAQVDEDAPRRPEEAAQDAPLRRTTRQVPAADPDDEGLW